MNDMPTPRTDAEEHDSINRGTHGWKFARTLERELALASAKVAEGEADKERLDWLERSENIAIDHATWAPHMPLAGQSIIHLMQMDDDCQEAGEEIATAPTLRAAIDAARTQETAQ